MAEGGEQLLGGALLDLLGDQFRGAAAEALAETEGGAAGVGGRQRGEARGPGKATASRRRPVVRTGHGYQGVVGWSTASVSAWVRRCVTSWYSGSATMRLNASREG